MLWQFSEDNLDKFIHDFTLSDQNADPTNWDWECDRDPSVWTPAPESLQSFRQMWYGGTESQMDPSLSLEPFNEGVDSSISSVYIRRSYLTMFDTVWAQAVASQGEQGVIITGQPGSGKTLFNFYLLVRLLLRRQVVLYSPEGTVVYLFDHNRVYISNMMALSTLGGAALPIPRASSNVFIWSLFDIYQETEPPRFLVTFPCFAVQTVSPDPRRYQTWLNHDFPLRTSLPLWTRNELAEGLKYQRKYRPLLDALERLLESNVGDPLYLFNGAVEVLHERYGPDNTPPSNAMEALEYLLDAAIVRFGHSARDVYGAIFFNDKMTRLHQDAFPNLNYENLGDIVLALLNPNNQRANHDRSQSILVLIPIAGNPLYDIRWNVDFKSDWIARHIINTLIDAEDDVIRQQISSIRDNPDAQAIARRLLGPLAHRFIANPKEGFRSFRSMRSNAADPLRFTVAWNTPVPDAVRLSPIKRTIVKFQSIANLSPCLKNNHYYIPTDPNFPFFDAFIVEFDRGRKSAVLWVLQMAMSRIHEGSSVGYSIIREIVGMLKEELQGAPSPKKPKAANGNPTTLPSVEVRYLLVVLKDERQIRVPKWQFPKGWDQNRENHDHCGDVYCLEVPLAV